MRISCVFTVYNIIHCIYISKYDDNFWAGIFFTQRIHNKILLAKKEKAISKNRNSWIIFHLCFKIVNDQNNGKHLQVSNSIILWRKQPKNIYTCIWNTENKKIQEIWNEQCFKCEKRTIWSTKNRMEWYNECWITTKEKQNTKFNNNREKKNT